ncbi:hypothetical protein [Sphingomonas sp. 10B4]|nr:hypothetical protein [Sphingomonas sp. 10B4]MEB0281660.1 hypothetical protein [Sphingomonas sp. 10B4]
MLEGLGEYDAAAVQAIVRDTMRRAPADRVWPWIARAIYRYEVELAADGFADLADPSADDLLEQVAKHAAALRHTLNRLSLLSLKSPAKVGKQNHANALRFGQALTDHFESKRERGGRSAFFDDLQFCVDALKTPEKQMADLRKRHAALRARGALDEYQAYLEGSTLARNLAGSPDLPSRSRGPDDPFLAGLVADLAEVWARVTGKKPSASYKFTVRDEGPPFVRLVNGCLMLAHHGKATPEQVKTALPERLDASPSK